MLTRTILSSSLLLLLVPVAACAPARSIPTPTPSARLVIPGTGDSQDVLREVAKAYAAQYPGRRVEIPDSIGSSGGIEWAGKGFVEMGRTAVRPSEDEQKKFGGLWYTEFARAPVVFVAHPNVQVKELTGEQICGLFSGATTNWRQVGGPDLAVKPQARPEGSNLTAIRGAIPCFRELKLPASAPMNTRNADLVQSIRTIEGSFGFMPLFEARVNGFTPIRMDGKEPGSATYPISISLAFVHKDPFAGLALDFIQFLDSEGGRKALEATGHIPVTPRSEPPRADYRVP